MKQRSYKIGRDVSRWLGSIECVGVLQTINLLYNAYINNKKNGTFQVKVPGLKFPINIRKKSTDVNVFMQVFAMKEYDIGIFKQSDIILKRYNETVDQGKEPLIIDCGANSGMATLWWQRLFPKAKIVSVEADSSNYAALVENTRQYASIACIHAAIWSRKTKVVLKNPRDEAWAFRFSEEKQIESESEMTPTNTITIQEILETHKTSGELLILKIDIEGGEKNLFSENVAWLKQVPLLIIETHDSLQPGEKTSLNFFREISKYDVELCFFGENLFAYQAE